MFGNSSTGDALPISQWTRDRFASSTSFPISVDRDMAPSGVPPTQHFLQCNYYHADTLSCSILYTIYSNMASDLHVYLSLITVLPWF
nr:hypothetical transcript [Hymenolepis microstoma]